MPDFPHSASHSFPWVRIIHYAILGLLVIGGLMYWALKPPVLNPMSDPMAAEAMALVQTHRARHASTLRQAIADRVQVLSARGQGVRLGEWTVERQQDHIYVVKIWIREQVTRGWFEREYVWKVNVAEKMVVPLTIAASDLMPGEADGETPSELRPARGAASGQARVSARAGWVGEKRPGVEGASTVGRVSAGAG